MKSKSKVVSDWIMREYATCHDCPKCNKEIGDYVSLNYHLAHDHKLDDVEADYIAQCIDPVKRVRELEVMQRNKEQRVIAYGEFFGNIITSNYNQNCMINIYGKQGMGKSNAAIEIATDVSKYVAKKMGGRSNDRGGVFSSDPAAYFTMDNVAIMKMETILPVLRHIDEHRFSIIVLDDIGGEWNARDSQRKQNKEMNKVIQTFRDANILLICTTVSDFLIDKVGRKLAHFQIEMIKSMHAKGLSIGKLKHLREYFNTGATYTAFPIVDNIQYTRIAFRRMAPEYAEAYESRRLSIRKKYTIQSLDAIENPDEPPKAGGGNQKYVTLAPAVARIFREHPTKSIRTVATELGVNKGVIINAIRYNRGEM